MAPIITQRKRHKEDEAEMEPTFDETGSFQSVSEIGASPSLPEIEPEEAATPAAAGPKSIQSTVTLPGTEMVKAAKAEKDRIIAAANAKADRMREDSRRSVAQKREDMLAAAVAEAEAERKKRVEKAKKDALAFKSKKMPSVPKVADEVFSQVFGDLF